MAVNSAAISAQLQTSLAAVQAAVAGIGQISAATPVQLSPVIAAVNVEIAVLQSAIAQIDADIITDSVAGMVSGPPAPTLWGVLLEQVSDSLQIAPLINALGYLQRLSQNLAQATG